nr:MULTISPECIES: class E sortase [unclassified Streptomyces]
MWGGAEAVVTCGVLILLLVVHQLWWTNQLARAEAGEQVSVLEREWEGEWGISPSSPASSSPSFPSSAAPSLSPSPSPSALPSGAASGSAVGSPSVSPSAPVSSRTPSGSAFAVLRIPRIGLTVPVAAGISKSKVLDKGYVGHYPGTAAPGEVGNVALAGHRNTHGEPFRYVNRLRKGDEITLRTREGTYTYLVDRILPVTSPRDTGVIQPVPRSIVKPSYGYSEAGSYLTLTTCTPEFTSRYRLIVWATLRR